ncbi:MAG: 23S rRNA (uracil(1939)-C(5))-methyltransferase RlmD [Cyclobacteriaceae bacterium]
MGRRKAFKLESIEIEAIADGGKCVAHHDGMAIFVKDVVPGDIVDIEAKKKRRNYLEGRPLKFISKSKNRTEPVCEHFGVCGGCKWQNLQYETQLSEKAKIVKDNLERIGKVDNLQINPIIGSDHQYFYRNKLEFTFSNNRWLTDEEIQSGEDLERNALGFHIPKLFDKIVDINKCHLQADTSNQIRDAVKEYALKNNLSFYDIREKKGFLRNLIVRTSSTNEVMVILQVGENDIALPDLLDHLKTTFPEITTLMYVVNSKMNETFNDLEVQTYSGQGFIWEEMPAYNSDKFLKFKIGPKSFFQTNSLQARKLYQIALDFADLKGRELVYDLYTGTGTIALYAAHLSGKVVGVEYVEDAIHDAEVNATENGISNVEFHSGDMKDVLNAEFVNENGKPDLIITDPPRAGMHPEVVQRLSEIEADKIVYISCNPATQARDIAILSEKYDVIKVQPVDMFPHTSHIENVVLLHLKK